MNSSKNHIRSVFFQSDYYSDYVAIVPFMDVAKPPVAVLCISVSTKKMYTGMEISRTHSYTLSQYSLEGLINTYKAV